MLLGPSGVDKTHLAVALWQRAVMAGIRTRFLIAADLMIQLAAGKGQGRLKEHFNRAIIGPKLLFVDERSYLPFGSDEARSGAQAGQSFFGDPAAIRVRISSALAMVKSGLSVERTNRS